MMDSVIAGLQEFEGDSQSKVIFACESGSRAYGVETSWSDYDVRFIYVQPIRHYLNVNKNRKESVSLKISPTIELNGWDLFKTMEFFTKSNPSLYEALFSPIVYTEDNDFIREAQRLAKSSFSLKTMSHHYLSMVKSNLKMINEKELQPTRYIKTILQGVRGLLMVKFIAKYQELPPVEFESLLVEGHLPESYRNEIIRLIQLKNTLNPSLTVDNQQDFISFIEKEVEHYQGKVESLPDRKVDKQLVNTLIWEILEV